MTVLIRGDIEDMIVHRHKLLSRSGRAGDKTLLSSRQKFRLQVFVALIDNFELLLKQRIDAYLYVAKLFGFLYILPQLSHADYKKSSLELISVYPKDFENDLRSELLQISSFLKRKSFFERPSQMTVEAGCSWLFPPQALGKYFPMSIC